METRHLHHAPHVVPSKGTEKGEVITGLHGLTRKQVAGMHIRVFYNEEGQSVPYGGVVESLDVKRGLRVRLDGYSKREWVTNEDEWEWVDMPDNPKGIGPRPVEFVIGHVAFREALMKLNRSKDACANAAKGEYTPGPVAKGKGGGGSKAAKAATSSAPAAVGGEGGEGSPAASADAAPPKPKRPKRSQRSPSSMRMVRWSKRIHQVGQGSGRRTSHLPCLVYRTERLIRQRIKRICWQWQRRRRMRRPRLRARRRQSGQVYRSHLSPPKRIWPLGRPCRPALAALNPVWSCPPVLAHMQQPHTP